MSFAPRPLVHREKSPAFIDELAEWAAEALLSVRIYRFFHHTEHTTRKITLTDLGKIMPLYPYHQRILWLFDQCNTINALTFIYSSHTRHVSVVN